LSKDKIIKEIAYMQSILEKRGAIFDYKAISFPEQYAFIQDDSRFVSALCTRRAGKTEGIAIKMIKKGLKHKNTIIPYFALTRSSAKDIMWSKLMEVVDKIGVKGDPVESSLEYKLPTGSIIKLFGADMKNFIPRVRGIKTPLACVDEAGAFGSHLGELVDDILFPATADYVDGQIVITGTPGRVPFGYFYDVTGQGKYNFSQHKWSVLNNPFMPDAKRLIEEIKKNKGWSDDNPTYRREWLGEWVTDIEALVFKYDHIKNHYDALPESRGQWHYVIGIDIGFNDADAISVIGWQDIDKVAYLVEEEVERGRDITSLAESVAKFIDKYDPDKVVMDTGGLGRKISEELNRRFSLPIIAAEKTRKFEYIELINDALKNGKLMAKNTSHFASDCQKLEWETENTRPDKRIISDRFHSDICDSVIYSWKEAMNWMSEPDKEPTIPYTDQWYEDQEEEIFQNLLNQQSNNKKQNAIKFGVE
jgi:hypothetical protein